MVPETEETSPDIQGFRKGLSEIFEVLYFLSEYQ
jgi:hypothetical protein